jgi:hypothetical protein
LRQAETMDGEDASFSPLTLVDHFRSISTPALYHSSRQ